jgi:hypothetical protein
MFTKLFEVKKWLNREPKTDKESRSNDDIGFLSEIISDDYQEIWKIDSKGLQQYIVSVF